MPALSASQIILGQVWSSGNAQLTPVQDVKDENHCCRLSSFPFRFAVPCASRKAHSSLCPLGQEGSQLPLSPGMFCSATYNLVICRHCCQVIWGCIQAGYSEIPGIRNRGWRATPKFQMPIQLPFVKFSNIVLGNQEAFETAKETKKFKSKLWLRFAAVSF